MQPKRTLIVLASLALSAGLFFSCTNPANNSSGNGVSPNLSFSVKGATAIAGNSTSSRILYSKGFSGIVARDSSLGSLVRINEDGTLASAISFGNNSSNWTPDVSFISVGEDKSVYICFSNMYQDWIQGTNGSSGSSINIQFVRVYPDNHYEVLWPLDPTNYNYSTSGQVNVWSWWGMDSDPLQKGDDGQLYFKVTSYSGGRNNDSVYSYDPIAGGKPVLRTPANGSFSVESFKVDSQKHLLIKSANNGTDPVYLRCYTQGVTAPVNIYYTSSPNSMWVRGYTCSPNGDSVIINGYGINSTTGSNGMTGIIRANILSPSKISMDLLYSNSVNANYIQLAQYSNWSSTSSSAIITCDVNNGYTWKWSETVLGSDGKLDKAKLINAVAPYYLGVPTITDDDLTTLNNLGLNVVQSFTWNNVTIDNYNAGNAISNYGEYFLKEFFSGKLFKDWLSENNLASLDMNCVGAMIWGTDNSLYGLYDQSWWGSASTGTKVLKLLDSSGNRDLQVVDLEHGNDKPTKIKFVGGKLYYRYAIMNGAAETGYHRLACCDLATGLQEDLIIDPALKAKNLEIQSYDVSSDGKTMYLSALDYDTNAVIFGKIDLSTSAKTFSMINANTAYSTVRTF